MVPNLFFWIVLNYHWSMYWLLIVLFGVPVLKLLFCLSRTRYGAAYLRMWTVDVGLWASEKMNRRRFQLMMGSQPSYLLRVNELDVIGFIGFGPVNAHFFAIKVLLPYVTERALLLQELVRCDSRLVDVTHKVIIKLIQLLLPLDATHFPLI